MGDKLQGNTQGRGTFTVQPWRSGHLDYPPRRRRYRWRCHRAFNSFSRYWCPCSSYPALSRDVSRHEFCNWFRSKSSHNQAKTNCRGTWTSQDSSTISIPPLNRSWEYLKLCGERKNDFENRVSLALELYPIWVQKRSQTKKLWTWSRNSSASCTSQWLLLTLLNSSDGRC